MQHRSIIAMSAAALLAASTTLATASTSSADTPRATDSVQAQPAGSFAFSGQAARSFTLPSDVRELHTTTFPDGRTQTRYQQMVGDASVLGGQITVIERADGVAESVIGAYFPGLEAKEPARLTKMDVRSEVSARIGDRGAWSNDLRINPRTGRLFYELDSIRTAHRPVRWVDAVTGEVVKSYDAVTHGEGIGVKGDTKDVDTTQNGSELYELRAADDRQLTYDAQNGGAQIVMTDEDDVWDLDDGISSPSQPAGVDAHFYSNLVDAFLAESFGRNSLDDRGMQMVSVVHYGVQYCNAFWNGAFMTYGDGDGQSCLPLSGGLDVVSHELTHGVTEHTSNLIYENESGALNEAFSDMLGNVAEFYADGNDLDPAAEPDWLIGEDILDDGSTNAGFRNMGDPAEDGDPSHYSLRYTGPQDNGGVHTNSGIANHAFYLSVEGGSNASCTANDAHDVLLDSPDCDVDVPAIGVDRAAQVYYEAFTGLPEYANFCDARNATLATAGGDAEAVGLAWEAVGVHGDCQRGTPPPPPCQGSANASLPIESPHPYGNNGDCRWRYKNGKRGFSFHFTLLDMEKDYDYVYVKNGKGRVLATYTGTATRGFDSPCINTPRGFVQMKSDAAVTGQGFKINRVKRC